MLPRQLRFFFCFGLAPKPPPACLMLTSLLPKKACLAHILFGGLVGTGRSFPQTKCVAAKFSSHENRTWKRIPRWRPSRSGQHIQTWWGWFVVCHKMKRLFGHFLQGCKIFIQLLVRGAHILLPSRIFKTLTMSGSFGIEPASNIAKSGLVCYSND